MKFNDTVFNTIDNGIIILDENLNILAWNRWLEIRTNILNTDVENKNICYEFSYIDEKKLKRKVKAALVTKSPSYFNVDPHKYLIKIRINSINSHYEFMQQDVTIVPYDLEKKIVCLYIYDKTALREINLKLELANKELIDLTNKDYLTKVYNRRYFNEYSEKALELAKRNEQDISIIAVDIDRFKKINDTYGHNVGDEVLIKVASIFKNSIRKSDIVARFGGEEFIILLINAKLEEATTIAEKMRLKIEDTVINVDENQIDVTASFGVATLNKETNESVETTLKRADDLLYIAKKHGRNEVVNSL
ncbi:sensor domain-containing diguanylate cyclase [Arcobacter sp. CECT 8983]|uniref:GGDEF domain-containing protein n=1 Tax=Arcobacter sp. CECT 8983 TaxID=2044508 RepID=UPI00100A57AE|nr:GGDEF domain-containing protein [Arcobacter sp. CECT 8983]RXJ91595.1 sensor domain-containing diguanylate cyclase [Arcobacter sp. CECT 8983]